MKVTSIASGSSGNCICVSADQGAILVDAGVSKKRIEEGLKNADIEINDVKALLVTHEHIDHVGGLGVMLRKYSIPVLATSETIDAIFANKSLGKLDRSLFNSINPDNEIKLSGFDITPFSVSHDAANPVGYTFKSENKKFAVCTDLGCFDDYTVENLKDSDAVLLEANHDLRMLQSGPYPYALKRRIWGDKGHLSNEDSGKLLSKIASKKLKTVILGHLSNENNYPDLAFEVVRQIYNLNENKSNLNLMVAKRNEYTPSVTV